MFDAGLAFSIARLEEDEQDETTNENGTQNVAYSWQVQVSCDEVDPEDPKQYVSKFTLLLMIIHLLKWCKEKRPTLIRTLSW